MVEDTQKNNQSNEFFQEQSQGELNESNNDALQLCRIELDAWKEKYLQINADLQNLQRRTVREQASWTHTLQSKILHEILSIVDDFARALQTQQNSSTESAKGFELIYQSLHKFLKNQGVTEFSEYTIFNPEIHEALMNVQSTSVKPGFIVEVFRKGYKLNGNLLRTAQVSVAE